MRILFVVPYVPSNIRSRSYEFVRSLTGLGASVHLVALRPPEDDWAPEAPVRALCARVDLFPLSRRRTLFNTLRAVPSTQPLQAAYSGHPEAQQHVRALVRGGSFDVLHIEHLRGVTLVRGISDLPVVFDAVDSIAHLFSQAARSAPRLPQRLIARLDLRRTERFEARAPWLFNRTIVTSAVDRDAFVRHAGPDARRRLEVVPNGVSRRYFEEGPPRPEAATVIFSGKMSYHANGAAALLLAREIMPRVWQQRPDARLIIAGKDPSDRIKALGADPRIEVTGYVEDLRPLLRRATVAAAPLVYGAGIQNKILEAMASGIPVVASPAAAGGLTASAGSDFLVADTPAGVADQVLRVLGTPALRESLAAAGYDYVCREHDWTALTRRLIRAYEEACADYRSRTAAATSR